MSMELLITLIRGQGTVVRGQGALFIMGKREFKTGFSAP
jgi:hypothetical protein